MSTARAGSPIDSKVIGYVNDGFIGQNSICRVKEETTGEVKPIHNPDDPAYLCVADDRLVLRYNIYLFDLKVNQILKISEYG